MKVIPVFSCNLLLRPQRSLPLQLRAKSLNKHDIRFKQSRVRFSSGGCVQPGSVLAAGSTSGHGRKLPQPSTAHTPTGASSTHPLVTDRGAAAPPPGRPTTLHLLRLSCASLSWVEVSSESSGSVTEMFPVADEQLPLGLSCDRAGETPQILQVK